MPTLLLFLTNIHTTCPHDLSVFFCLSVCLHVYMHVYVCVCVCACMCMCVCVCVCVCVCGCMFSCVCDWVCCISSLTHTSTDMSRCSSVCLTDICVVSRTVNIQQPLAVSFVSQSSPIHLHTHTHHNTHRYTHMPDDRANTTPTHTQMCNSNETDNVDVH